MVYWWSKSGYTLWSNPFWTAAALAIRSTARPRLLVRVHRVMDARAQCTPEQLHHFWSSIRPETVRDFSRGGITLQTTDGPGEVKTFAGDQPILR